MKKIDQFILKAFVGPFVAILLVVIFVLVMQFLWVYIDELVGKGLKFSVILEFMWWGSCTILPMALPLSTLLASMMTMGTLGENNELLAMKAAGISMLRVMAPMMTVTLLVISIGTYYVTNNLVPISYNKIYTLRDDILHTKEEIKIPSGTFYDGIDGYILRVDTNDERTGMMRGVMVYDHTKGKGNTTVTLADSAMMRMSKEKDYLTFTLYNGINYQETNTKRYRDTTLELSRVKFDKQDLIISLHNYAFKKSEGDRFGDQIKAMPMDMLRHQEDSLLHVADSTLTDHIDRFQGSGNLQYNKQLDTAILARGRQNFYAEGQYKWKDVPSKRAAYERAVTKANMMANEMTSFGRESYEYQFWLRRSSLEILRRIAAALACFILFFIGAPLGALIRKGGLGTSAIVSVLFFVLYWVVDITGTKLAKDGAVTPSTGAFIATYVLFPIGLFLTWKALNDASFMNKDNILSWWRTLRRKVGAIFRKTRIIYMGTPEFAVAPLDALRKAGYEIVAVVTVPDKPAGRGLKVSESAVKKYAVQAGIPVLQPEKLKDPSFLTQLASYKADMFVVVAFRMLPEEVWSMPRLGTFNLHASLLPQYRGAAPINWAVINGEHMTGVTTFMIDKNIDTGGIIFREEYRISETDTAGDVHDALMALGSDLVVHTVDSLVEGAVELRVQRSFIQGDEVLKPAPKLTRELCQIDWSRSTNSIYNLIRGLSPYPAAFTTIPGGDQIKIFRAHKLSFDEVSAAGPGAMLTDGKTYLAFTTADGAISIDELQLAGKKRMAVADFLRGWRD